MAGDTVLVTGGSGFIAGWCIRRLLEAGCTVRASVRSLAREQQTRRTIGGEALDPSRLSFHAADLTSDAGWLEAAAGARFVLHLASPFPLAAPRDENELIAPARDGALRLLRAAKAGGVERVVLTSSMAAVAYGHAPDRTDPFTEADWTDVNGPGCSAYIKSKTIAERAAWDWSAAEGQGPELVAMNPSAVMGPILGPDLSTSVEVVKMLLSGGLPAIPRVGFSVVDVRDVAELHYLAMTQPHAAGERFLAAGPFLWLDDIAAILRDALGRKARRVPNRRLPDFVVRLGARFDGTLRTIESELGQFRPVSSDKAIASLGWRPRGNAEAIVASAESLLAAGLVRG